MTVEEKKIDKIKEILTKIINRNNIIEGKYEMPYSTSSDDLANWKVKFKVSDISLWRKNSRSEVGCSYSGSIYITMLDIRVGFDGDWEEMRYITDLPSWVEEDITEEIIENINNFLPMVCVDITFD